MKSLKTAEKEATQLKTKLAEMQAVSEGENRRNQRYIHHYPESDH
jgi:hypothetical protein